MKRATMLAMTAFVAACQGGPGAAPTATGALGGDVARVGNTTLPGNLVGAVAAARRVSVRDALDLLVDDAVAAEGARARGMEDSPDVRFPRAQALSRVTLAHLLNEAAAAGPPSADEVTELTRQRWREIDRPDAIRVIHAVVVKKANGSPDDEAAKIAAAIAAAVASATSAADFETKALAVPKGDHKVQVEELVPFVLDGRKIEGIPDDSTFLKSFTEAAFRIPAVGQTSPPSESEAGYHVIRLLEKIPGHVVPLAERAQAVADDAVAQRARKAIDKLLAARRRAATAPEPAAETLMAGFIRDKINPPNP